VKVSTWRLECVFSPIRWTIMSSSMLWRNGLMDLSLIRVSVLRLECFDPPILKTERLARHSSQLGDGVGPAD
jgi:hypothetical protein